MAQVLTPNDSSSLETLYTILTVNQVRDLPEGLMLEPLGSFDLAEVALLDLEI